MQADATLQTSLWALNSDLQDLETQNLIRELAQLNEQIFAHRETISLFPSDSEEMERCKVDANYFTRMDQEQFDSRLVYLVKIFIDKFDSHQADFQDLFINKFSVMQRRDFILKLSSQILYLDPSSREMHITHLLSLINLDQLKEAIKVASQKTLQSDAVFSLAVLINATLSAGKESTDDEDFLHQLVEKGKELGGFLADDIHQLLLAFETLNQSPTNPQDALGYLSGQMIILQLLQVLVPAAAIVFPVAIPALLMLPIAGSVSRKIYFNWYLSAPHSLPPLVLYSKKETSSLSHRLIGRDALFDKMTRIWNKKKHPILVGPPGSGKSTFLAELGRRISLVQMKGFNAETVVYGGSSFSLVEGDNTEVFQRIIKTAAVYRKNVILAFDEAHAFASNRAMNLLKSALDNSNESLRYVILATTPTGYEELCASDTDGALARRMTKIELGILDKEQMSTVIRNEAQEIAPLLQLTESAVNSIYTRANGKMNESRQLLHRILTKAENQNSTSESEAELDKKKTELNNLGSELRKNLLSHDPLQAHQIHLKIREVQSTISELKDKSLENELAKKNHEYLCTHAEEVKNTIIRLSQKINRSFVDHLEQKKIKLEDFSSEEQFTQFNAYVQGEELMPLMSEFLFYSYLYGIPLTKTLEKFEHNNGFIRIIDDQFVNKVE
jgi:DNA polymerase III delta prime subunit